MTASIVKFRKRDCCLDCGVNTSTIGEEYVLHDEVWNEAVPRDQRNVMLCIGCVETRLHRRLAPYDFDRCAANFDSGQSLRLSARLWGAPGAWRGPQGFVDHLIDEVISVLRRDQRIAGLLNPRSGTTA